MDAAAGALDADGRVWFRAALTDRALNQLDTLCAMEGAPGARLAWTPEIAAALADVSKLADALLPGARPVRLIAFDKSGEMNWGLPWHQDRVVAVRERVQAPGFSNWSRKSGVWHAEPPPCVMSEMLFARVHLDAAGEDNGCLELALGSHTLGKVADVNAEQVAMAGTREACVAARGDVLFAKALILHRSRPSRKAASRRALRIDYSALSLPAPVQWAIEPDSVS